MNPLEKTLITSLEASKMLGVHETNAIPMLRRRGLSSSLLLHNGKKRLFWLRQQVQRVAQDRAEKRGEKFAPPEIPIDPLEGKTYTTREAALLLGITVSTAAPALERLGVVPARKSGGKAPCLWLKTDIEALKTRLEAERLQPQKRPSLVETTEGRAERLKREFFERYGAYPFERPDLVGQWCEMLNQKAV